jgi:hypothetical protein
MVGSRSQICRMAFTFRLILWRRGLVRFSSSIRAEVVAAEPPPVQSRMLAGRASNKSTTRLWLTHLCLRRPATPPVPGELLVCDGVVGFVGWRSLLKNDSHTGEATGTAEEQPPEVNLLSNRKGEAVKKAVALGRRAETRSSSSVPRFDKLPFQRRASRHSIGVPSSRATGLKRRDIVIRRVECRRIQICRRQCVHRCCSASMQQERQPIRR